MKGMRRLTAWLLFAVQIAAVAFGLHQLSGAQSSLSIFGGFFLGLVATTLCFKFLRTREELFAELKEGGTTRIRAIFKSLAILGAVSLDIAMMQAGMKYLGCPKGWSLPCAFVPVVLFYFLSTEEDRAIFQKLEKIVGWLIFVFQAASTSYAIFVFFGSPKETEKIATIVTAGSIISIAINLLERAYFFHFEEAILPLVEKIRATKDWYDILIEALLVAGAPLALIYTEIATSVMAFVAFTFPIWISVLASIALTPAFESLTEDEKHE